LVTDFELIFFEWNYYIPQVPRKNGMTMVLSSKLFVRELALLKNKIKNDEENSLTAFGEKMRNTLDSLGRR
jgi:hypothetical protein